MGLVSIESKKFAVVTSSFSVNLGSGLAAPQGLFLSHFGEHNFCCYLTMIMRDHKVGFLDDYVSLR